MAEAPRIGLALGGGAARGLAHIVLLEAFDELGIRPHRMSGTSMGALVGAAYASGLTATAIRDHATAVLRRPMDAARLAFNSSKGSLLDLINARPWSSSLIDGRQLTRLVLPAGVAVRVEGTAMPFTIVATDFHAGCEIAITAGDMVAAIAASIAIPGFIASPPLDGRVVIDGGCVNPVPIDHVQDQADIVVGIDVVGRPVARDERLPNAAELAAGSIQIQQRRIAELRRATVPCDIYIAPDVDRFRVHEFFNIDAILAAALPAKERLKRALEARLEKRVRAAP